MIRLIDPFYGKFWRVVFHGKDTMCKMSEFADWWFTDEPEILQ